MNTKTNTGFAKRIPVLIIQDPVRFCCICGGISRLTVNGNRVCGDCLHSGKVLELLQQEKANA